MNWLEMINFNFHQLRGELADLWRNNRQGIWEFLADRVVYLVFFAGAFVMAHMASIGGSLLITPSSPDSPGGWALAMILDFVWVMVSTIAMWGALVQVAILYTGGALLVDGLEGVPNIIGGLFRRIAQARGVAADIPGDEDIGLDKIRNAARETRAAVFILTIANLFWWLVIWGAYVSQQPIATVERITLFLTYALVFCCGGYASTYSSALRTETDAVQAQVWRTRIRLGWTGAGLFGLLFTGLLVNRFTQISQLGWSEWEWLVAGGILLLFLGSVLRAQRGADGRSGGMHAVGRWTQRLAIVMLLVALGPSLYGWWSANKDTVQRDILPSRAATAVEKLSENMLSSLDGTAQAATTSSATAAPPAPATTDLDLEFCNCLPRAGTLSVKWKAPDGGMASLAPPYDRSFHIAARGEAGARLRIEDLEAPAGVVLALQFVEHRRHDFEVSGAVDPVLFRRDPRFSSPADPARSWKPLPFADGAWQFKLGCADDEEP